MAGAFSTSSFGLLFLRRFTTHLRPVKIHLPTKIITKKHTMNDRMARPARTSSSHSTRSLKLVSTLHAFGSLISSISGTERFSVWSWPLARLVPSVLGQM